VRVALVNPPWSFEGSVYFGCREGHLPLELGYAKARLEQAGHDVLLVDAQLGATWNEDVTLANDANDANDVWIRHALESFRPDMTAITTAPSYLAWRCAPPELGVPMATAAAVRDVAGTLVAIGPHASTTPRATLRKLGADVAIVGECEDVLVNLADAPPHGANAASVVWLDRDELTGRPEPRAADVTSLPALLWPAALLRRHRHHHHRFERRPVGTGAELEASRACPYHCAFCTNGKLPHVLRKRPVAVVLAELDGLIAAGARYVYFIDEIFLPDRRLLEGVRERDIAFGIRMRIGSWTPSVLDLLGEAGCVSIELGVERSPVAGLLDHAKKCVPCVWANEQLPIFPYPGSPEYTMRFGDADDEAWERARRHYLSELASLERSDHRA
jgi:B12-binding domain/radical SAM domain protein of rhizo-twelve system